MYYLVHFKEKIVEELTKIAQEGGKEFSRGY